MKKILILPPLLFIISGCAGFIAGKYGVKKETDKFNSNETKIIMTGGVIDLDYLGIVANQAEFNPLVIRSQNNKIIETAIVFTFENNTTYTNDSWLNINQGDTAIFLLNGGSEKITLTAVKGDFDYSVTLPQSTVYTTKYDSGIFPITPDQLKMIACANSIEIRVSGSSSSVDFPRKPNNHLLPSFLSNYRTFYENEVKPYLKPVTR